MARKKATKKKAAKKKAKSARRPRRRCEDPAAASAAFREGIAALESGRHDEAIVAGSVLVKLDPDRASSWTIRGLGRRRTGDLEGALADFDEAVALEPNAPGARDARALLYFDLLRWEEARDELRRYLALEGPVTDFLHLRLWLVRTKLGEADADRALRAQAEVVGASKDPARAWWSALAAHLLGDLSLADLRAATSTPEQRCEAGFFAGARCFALGDRAGAHASFERCVGQGVTAFTEHHSAVALDAALSPHPKGLLRGVSWVLGRGEHASAAAFGEAVAAYQRELRGQDAGWEPGALVLAAPQVVVTTWVWEGKKQVDRHLILTPDEPRGFTAAELLWKVHTPLVGANLGDHRFFEGLTLAGVDEPPRYTVRRGS